VIVWLTPNEGIDLVPEVFKESKLLLKALVGQVKTFLK
jgi:hypothetical protein